MKGSVQTVIDQLVQESLVLAAKAHVWHLSTRSYASHMALGDLYEYFHDIADRISETCQGAGGGSPESSSTWSFKFTPANMAISETEAYIGKLVEAIDAIGALDSSLGWLINILEEIQGNLYGILYKLKRLS